MDKNNHYNDDNNITHDNNISNDRKSFSQRLGEVNVMPDGMLSAVDDTDLAILAIEKGAQAPPKIY